MKWIKRSLHRAHWSLVYIVKSANFSYHRIVLSSSVCQPQDSVEYSLLAPKSKVNMWYKFKFRKSTWKVGEKLIFSQNTDNQEPLDYGEWWKEHVRLTRSGTLRKILLFRYYLLRSTIETFNKNSSVSSLR